MPKSPQPALNFATLPLPTDRIEVGQLRRRQPAIFDRYSGWNTPAGFLEVFATINLEHVLARRAFADAAGQSDPHPDVERNEIIRLLNDDYRRFGISSGTAQTRLLVLDIENAAATQAIKPRGIQR